MRDQIGQERDRTGKGPASARPSRSKVSDLNENSITRSVFDHIRSRGVPGLVAFHVPNGGYRRPVEAAILKGMGVVPGVADVILLHAGRFYALEIKRADQKVKPGSAQDQFLNQVWDAGGQAAWAAGLDNALRQLERWKLLRGETA